MARAGRLAGGDASIEQRQLHLALRRGARQQVEALEDEADLPVAQVCQAVLAQPAGLGAADAVAAARGAIEQAEHVHQRALARTAGADDGHIFALVNGQRYAAQGVYFGLPHHVDLGQVDDLDDGCLGWWVDFLSLHRQLQSS